MTVGRLPAEPPVVWTVAQLPYGEYALKAYHDLNDNGELDRSPVGLPTEPYGFSNDARARFGPPRYAEARFAHAAAETALEVELR